MAYSPPPTITWQEIAWRLILTALLLLTLAASTIFIFNPSSQTEPYRLPLSQQVNSLVVE
jgi:type IV secretory pathway component VirB8